MIGQLIFSTCTLTWLYFGTLPFLSIIGLILSTVQIKIIITSFFSIIATIIVYYLKKLEGIDVYDNDIKFNPFGLKVDLQK